MQAEEAFPEVLRGPDVNADDHIRLSAMYFQQQKTKADGKHAVVSRSSIVPEKVQLKRGLRLRPDVFALLAFRVYVTQLIICVWALLSSMSVKLK